MSQPSTLPITASLDAYLDQARALFADLQAGDEATAWRFKWEHPRFRDKQVGEVKSTTLDLDDAKLVTARSYAVESWDDLVTFAERASTDGAVDRFETA